MTHQNFQEESREQKQKRAKKILGVLKRAYPRARMALRYSNNWELLVAVILSAQCTDKKVNEVTAKLFKKYHTLNDYVRADHREFEKDIYQTGFFRSKTKNILGAARMIRRKFGGKIPKTMKEILEIPGVARKTANIVLGNAYGIIEGVAVDTHVRRISQRFGLTFEDNPEKIEQDLMGLFPKKEWFKLTYRIIEHGRAVCRARDPRCDLCPLKHLCPSAFQFPRFSALDEKVNK